MNGIEKITGRIASDAQAEAQRVLSEARAEAQAITSARKAEAQAAREEILAQAQTQARQREERLENAAELEGRKILLEEKQKVLSQTFDLALKKLRNMSQADYTAFLTKLLLQASATGRETVVMNQHDRDSVGEAVVAAANQALARAVAPKLPQELTGNKVGALVDKVVSGVSAVAHGTGMLILSAETRDIQGGFILTDGPIEVNCSLDTLLEQTRERLSGQVAQTLFTQAS